MGRSLAIVAIVLLAAPASAFATSHVYYVNDEREDIVMLVIEGDEGVNTVSVTSGDTPIYTVTDSSGVRVTPNSAYCERSSPTVATCTGGWWSPVLSVDLGGGGDSLSVAPDQSFNGSTIHGGSGGDRIRIATLPSGYGWHSTIRGQAGDDAILGSPKADLIDGGSGDDRLNGRGGNDEVVGGLGPDRLLGGSGRDRIEASEHDVDAFIGCGSENDIAFIDGIDPRPVASCEKFAVVKRP